MKRLRILVLVLLAVLLPIRGAVAAAMLCPAGGAAGAAAVAVVAEHGHHGMQGDHAMHADHAEMQHHAGANAADDDSPSGAHATACPLCASGCCMASIVGMFPSLGEPGLTSMAAFPALTAPVPAFQSGGQDRPPRTI